MAIRFGRIFATMACAATMSLASPAPAYQGAAGALAEVRQVLQGDKSGEPVDIQGVVVEAAFDSVIALRDATGTIIVRLPAGSPRIGRGDLVRAKGKSKTERRYRPIVEGAKVTVLSRSRVRVPATRAANVRNVLDNNQPGDVVTLFGVVGEQRGSRMYVKDDTGGIWVELGDRFGERFIPAEAHVALIGEIADGGPIDKKIINSYGLVDTQDLKGIELDSTDGKIAKPLAGALHGVKAGEKIVARGRIMKFAGTQVRDVLYDGSERLVIDYAEGPTSQMPSGEEVIVKGTLEFTEYKGIRVAIVRKAVVVATPVSAPR